jgi:predicted ester cyclase
MSTEDNKRLVRRFVREGLGDRRVDVIDELIGRPGMANNLKEGLAQIAEILSDMRYGIDYLVAEGNTVAVFCTLYGTHTGKFQSPLLTVPATGRDVAVEVAYRIQIVDGKIDMIVSVTDLLGLITQIAS